MSDRYDPALEAALSDLGAAIRFPSTPPLAAGIAAYLLAQPRVGWWPRFGSLQRSLVLAVVGLLAVGCFAGAMGIGIGAIQIRFADGTPLPTPLASVANRGYGTQTTLAQAEAAVPFAIRLPGDGDLGPPNAVFLADVPRGGTVTLVWGELIVTQFSADIGPDTFEKMITGGTRVEPVSVNGQAGWWVEGGTHAFFYRDVNGNFVDTSLRLVTSALIWEEDGLVLRVEGAPSLEAALRVAASLE
jgi:hypothetical protein